MVVRRFEQLHKGKGQDQGGGEAHDGNGKKHDPFKIFEILEEGGGEVGQEIRTDLRTVKCKENREHDGSHKTGDDAGGKAFAIIKIGS